MEASTGKHTRLNSVETLSIEDQKQEEENLRITNTEADTTTLEDNFKIKATVSEDYDPTKLATRAVANLNEINSNSDYGGGDTPIKLMS